MTTLETYIEQLTNEELIAKLRALTTRIRIDPYQLKDIYDRYERLLEEFYKRGGVHK